MQITLQYRYALRTYRHCVQQSLKKGVPKKCIQCKRKCIDCAIAAQDVRILKLFGSPQRAKIPQSLVKNPEDPEDSEDTEGN